MCDCSPKEPPPPPPPEASWEDVQSEVSHLSDDTYKSFLKKKKHTLVMFYAPCKWDFFVVYPVHPSHGWSLLTVVLES